MNILLPIETINRELDYKLILGVKLVEKDRVIYIGQHDYLFGLSRFLRSGLYLGKTMFKDLFPTNLKYYNELKARDIDLDLNKLYHSNPFKK